jgi:hypothetical protein
MANAGNTVQVVVLGRHLDFVARLELASDQFHGRRNPQWLLHGAFERALYYRDTRPLRVVA